jgi:FixJ family two-component response regulator
LAKERHESSPAKVEDPAPLSFFEAEHCSISWSGEPNSPLLEESVSTMASAVFVVDDDPSVRKLIASRLAISGQRVEAFASAQKLLEVSQLPVCGCLILDVQLPGMNCLKLRQRLSHNGEPPPIVFITSHGDTPTSIQAMKTAGMDFLLKPFTEEALLSAVQPALDRNRRQHAVGSELGKIQELLAKLTKREAEVLRYVAAGWLNKQVAAELGMAEKTVKLHRGRIMQKLCADSLADLVRLAVKSNYPLPA